MRAQRLAMTALAITAGLLLAGCDPDCGNPARLDGNYDVWQNVADASTVSGENLSAYPYDDTVFNGASAWNIKWVPGDSSFQLSINDQPFTGASYDESETGCNTFTLLFDGSYEAEPGSVHALTWEGELTWYGDELNGNYTYTDTWANDETGTSGTINVPDGVFVGTLTGG